VPTNLDSCITGIFIPGNIGASSGQTPVQPTVPSFSVGNYGAGTAAGVGGAHGDTNPSSVGTAAGVGAASGVSPSWTATFNAPQPFTNNSTGWTNHCHRERIYAAQISTSGSQVRITMRSSPSAGGCTIDAVSFGQAAAAGNVWDFAGTPTSGTAPGAIAANSAATVVINVAVDETKDYIVAWHMAGGDVGEVGMSGPNFCWKGGADESTVTAPSGYTPNSNLVLVISKLEVM